MNNPYVIEPLLLEISVSDIRIIQDYIDNKLKSLKNTDAEYQFLGNIVVKYPSLNKNVTKILLEKYKKCLRGENNQETYQLMQRIISALSYYEEDGTILKLIQESKNQIDMYLLTFFWGILLDFLIPVLICFIILSIATGNWEDALIVLQEERRKCIILVLFIIFSNAIIVFAVGYCMVYSFQKDLIEKNRRNKRKEPKKNLSRKHKYRWKNKDYQLIGWLLIIVAIVFYGAYVNWQGIQNAQKQELFLTTRIDNDTYIVVMTDGDEAILEKDRTGKDGKLKICKDKYMKVDCKNRLLEKKKYRRASGDGE